jgi:hypothetical protein
MSRITLAFSSFFRLLFGGKLSPRAVEYLPEEALKALPAARDTRKDEDESKAKAKPKAKDEPKAKGTDKDAGKDTDTDTDKDKDKDKDKAKAEPKPAPKPHPADLSAHHTDGALALLALLQREGRLVDFLRESIDDYDDEDIGAAVRDIHRGCKKVLDDHLDIEPVMPGEEDDEVKVPKGFDPGEVRLIGDVSGDPPFDGTLRHHGWRVVKASLPTLSDGVDRRVLAPAEVEVAGGDE